MQGIQRLTYKRENCHFSIYLSTHLYAMGVELVECDFMD